MQVSNDFKEFVAYYVEGVIYNGELISRQKYLQRYCALENCDFIKLQENLCLLIDALHEYKEKKTKVFLKVAQYQAKSCYLPKNFIKVFAKKLLSWNNDPISTYSYMMGRGGDIFDDMPGGNLLKRK